MRKSRIGRPTVSCKTPSTGNSACALDGLEKRSSINGMMRDMTLLFMGISVARRHFSQTQIITDPGTRIQQCHAPALNKQVQSVVLALRTSSCIDSYWGG